MLKVVNQRHVLPSTLLSTSRTLFSKPSSRSSWMTCSSNRKLTSSVTAITSSSISVISSRISVTWISRTVTLSSSVLFSANSTIVADGQSIAFIMATKCREILRDFEICQVSYHYQWRIKDFLRGASTPKVGMLKYYFAIFCRKLHENERIRIPKDEECEWLPLNLLTFFNIEIPGSLRNCHFLHH